MGVDLGPPPVTQDECAGSDPYTQPDTMSRQSAGPADDGSYYETNPWNAVMMGGAIPRRLPEVDPERIVAFGSSFGSFWMTQVAATQPRLLMHHYGARCHCTIMVRCLYVSEHSLHYGS